MGGKDGETGEEVREGEMGLERWVAETLSVEDGDGVDSVGCGVREDVQRRKSRVERSHESFG